MADVSARRCRGDGGFGWLPIVIVVIVVVALVFTANPIKNRFFPKKSVRPAITTSNQLVPTTTDPPNIIGSLNGPSDTEPDQVERINPDTLSCLFDSLEDAPKVDGQVAYGAGGAAACTATITWDFCSSESGKVIPAAAAIQMWSRDPDIDGFKFRWRLRTAGPGIAWDDDWSAEATSGPVPPGSDGLRRWQAVAGPLGGVSGVNLSLGQLEAELDLTYTKPARADLRHTVRYVVVGEGACTGRPGE